MMPRGHYFSAYGTETYTAGYNLLSAGIGGNLVNAAGKKVIELFIEGTNLANVNYQSNLSRLNILITQRFRRAYSRVFLIWAVMLALKWWYHLICRRIPNLS